MQNSISIELTVNRSEANQLRSNTERFPYEMVISAERVPDQQDVHVTETVSAIKDFDQSKQLVTIEDYEEDEIYAYDQETENGTSFTCIIFIHTLAILTYLIIN